MYRSRTRSRTPSPARSVRAPPASTPKRSRHERRDRGYSFPRDKERDRSRSSSPVPVNPPSRRSRSEITFLLCVFHTSSHNWTTKPVRFNPNRITDRELWQDIRDCFRFELRKPWLRWLSFRHVTAIVPVSFTLNGVPKRVDPKDFPDAKLMRHAYHHPESLKTTRYWVNWFVDLDASDPDHTNGLEFREGLWADKLGAVAILATIGIVVACIIWCALGGDLQTVFTVMGFVLTLVAAEIALIALYYQMVSNDTGTS